MIKHIIIDTLTLIGRLIVVVVDVVVGVVHSFNSTSSATTRIAWIAPGNDVNFACLRAFCGGLATRDIVDLVLVVLPLTMVGNAMFKGRDSLRRMPWIVISYRARHN